jgi:hypothetical protein
LASLTALRSGVEAYWLLPMSSATRSAANAPSEANAQDSATSKRIAVGKGRNDLCGNTAIRGLLSEKLSLIRASPVRG